MEGWRKPANFKAESKLKRRKAGSGSTQKIIIIIGKLLSFDSQSKLGSVGLTQKIFFIIHKGIARTQSPTNKNYALELPTFGAIVGVSQTEVQWNGLILEEPPSWSRLTSVPGKYALLRNVKTIYLLWMIRIYWKDRTLLPITFTRQKNLSGTEQKKFWVWLFQEG